MRVQLATPGGFGLPGAGATGNCEPDVDAGN